MEHPGLIPSVVRLASSGRAREAWPLDPDLVHLNHGSFGAVPTQVVEYHEQLRKKADRSPVSWFPRIGEYVAQAREQIAPFVGAAAGDLAFVPNASAAATVVFNSLRLQPDDEILVTDHGYGAVTMGARRLARRFGARLRAIHLPLLDGEDEIVERFEEAIGDRTRLVVVDQITSPTARGLPTKRITEVAHSRGARVLVDGAHAPGLIEHPVSEAGGDWWFGNLHKWPCAPRGAALLATSAVDRQELWPLIDSWAAEDPFPARFDVQGTIDATSYLAAPRAVDFIEREYGWARTRQVMAELADHGAAVISTALQPHVTSSASVELPMPTPSMRLIRLPDGLARTREEADDLRMQILDRTGVETAFTSFDDVGYLRLSVHLYTESSDFDAFVERCVPLIVEFASQRPTNPPTPSTT
ncbi:aminotransferase class V-fold PLP-dependent enzyme [Phytoactinopolyspora mesophila]|uniref:Aminotransferase class V-fold PLP-dependent enzyme n=1 Tax=Phytoactinopolyspora mesophila TaxID=2650750 RepID=A0A7K3LYL7_9ACTN|nr:aminotransferase class V-fold PLP-dependent enzyme [Phytoactinopolyspora mesophila]NDL55772.1 aminotransferase class V-fold PLP-dependent enzyme [Phytoactinopolyspora mesophila]